MTPIILDDAPIELMIVDDVTGDGDPYNTADSGRSRTLSKAPAAVEFVRGGRHYLGDRLPEEGERPRYIRDDVP